MTTETKKSTTPFDVITKCLSKVDFDSLEKLNRSVKELITDKRYCNFLTRQPFWYLDCEYVTSVAVTSVFRPASGREYLDVDVSLRNEESYDNQTLEHISIPIVYLTDRKTLEQDMAAEKTKQEKKDEERERQQYLELQKKYGDLK